LIDFPRPTDPEETKHALWFSEEVQAHASSLRAYLRRSFPWLRDVDDLVQDSLGKLWRRRENEKVRSGKALLFATARNAALDLHRKNRVVGMDSMGEMDQLSVLDDKPGVAETVTRNQELEILSEAIRALPDRSLHPSRRANAFSRKVGPRRCGRRLRARGRRDRGGDLVSVSDHRFGGVAPAAFGSRLSSPQRS